MKQVLTAMFLGLLVLAFSTVLSALPSEDDASSQTPETRSARLPVPINTDPDQVQRPVQGMGYFPDAQEVHRLRKNASSASGDSRCADFSYQGDTMSPVPKDGGHVCRPGYNCHANGIFFECRWSGGDPEQIMTAADPGCRDEVCGQALPDVAANG